MTVQSEDDFAEGTPKCLRCWPTGVSCVRFYAVLFFSIAAVFVAGLYLILSNFVPAVANANASCAMAALISSTIAFWLQPPSINDAVPMMVGQRHDGAPPLPSDVEAAGLAWSQRRRIEAAIAALSTTRSSDSTSSSESDNTGDILRRSQRLRSNVRSESSRKHKPRRPLHRRGASSQ